jgi:parallel beta helix pectate lyase-like protein
MMRISGAVGIAVVAAGLLFPSLAYAQATRTWVSGVGDDANPCSRTAPCKTFPGAISKTAAGGEIDTLDPGGFGAVTITKEITIDGTSGLAGVLVSGTNGIIINAGTNDAVILRNLDINGIGSGISGILILAAGDVRVENCKIYGFSNRGIDDRRSSGRLAVSNTVVSDNAQTGILTLAASGSTLAVNLDHVQMHNNGNAGFATTGGTHAIVSHSSATSNVYGFYADSGASLHLDDVVSFANSNTGVAAFSSAAIRLFNSTVTNNNVGIGASSGGSVGSFGLNRIFGNASGNAPNGTLPLQ